MDKVVSIEEHVIVIVVVVVMVIVRHLRGNMHYIKSYWKLGMLST